MYNPFGGSGYIAVQDGTLGCLFFESITHYPDGKVRPPDQACAH
jgi:hypothetical protein